MKNKIYLIALASVILGACNFEDDDRRTKNQIFRYNLQPGNNITSLDPAFAKNQANIWPIHQMYNGLLQFDDNYNIAPAIAKEWAISEDGLTYTFHLRDDVLFHDHELFENEEARKVTAHDFVYSFNRIISPETASPGAWVFSGRIAADSPFTAVDDHTLQVRLQRSFAPFLNILTMPYTYVVPQEIAEHYGKEFREHPVGTGPFKFSHWEEGRILGIVKNEQYWEKDEQGNALPYLDGVEISFVESPQVQLMKFKRGEIDFMSGIEGYKEEVITREGNLVPELEGKVKMIKGPYLNMEYIGVLMDPENPLTQGHPFQDKRVRQALNYAIDKKKMVKYLRNGIGIPATAGFIPKGLPAFDTSMVRGYTYNPEKALRLLAEAGYPLGEGFPTIHLFSKNDDGDISTYVQNELSEVGIKVKIELLPGAFISEKRAKSQALFFRGSWLADYFDAENFLTVFYGPNPAPPNYTRFKNVRFDSLYQIILTEPGADKRQELYHEMDKIIIEEAPVIPLFYDEVVRFVQKNVEGLGSHPMNLLELKKVRFKSQS